MLSPFRIQSAKRFTTTKCETKPMFFISKKKKRIVDKESLDDIVKQIKLQNNDLILQNKQLKQDNVHLQKQINKQEKVLQLNKQVINQKKTQDEEEYIRIFTEETCQVLAYQKQLKDLEMQIKYKDITIEELKRDTRKTKLQEVQVSQYLYILYRFNLKSLKINMMNYIDKIKLYFIKCNNNDIISQFNRKETFVRDNMYLSQQLLETQQNLNQQTLKIKQLEHEIQLSSQYKKQMEKLMQEKDKEIQLTKFEYSNPRKTILELNKSWQSKLDLLQYQLQRFENEYNEKIEIIENLEKKLKDSQSSFGLKEQYYKKEIDNLHMQIEQLRSTIHHMEMEQMEELDSQNEDSVISDQQQKKAPLSSSRRKMQKVSLLDVTPIGWELAAKLKINRIPFAKIDQLLYSKAIKGFVSLTDLIELFKQNPFDLTIDQAQLLGRFMIEAEQEDWIYFDINQTNEIIISISIFKNLIKPYELIQEEEEEQLWKEICQILKLHQGKMQDLLNLSGEYCSYQEFKKSLEYCDIFLNTKLEDYLSIKIFEKFKQYLKLKHQSLFEYFK